MRPGSLISSGMATPNGRALGLWEPQAIVNEHFYYRACPNMGHGPYSRMPWRQSSKAISSGTKKKPNRTSTSTVFPAEATTVFADPAAVYLDDGSETDRMVVVGTSLRDRVLYVVHVERGRRDRIISARPATRAERDVYESGEHP